MAPRTAKPQPEAPLPNQVCGVEIDRPGAAAKAMCALPPGHEGEHSPIPPYVSPLRAEARVPTPEENAAAATAFAELEGAKRPVIVKLARIMAGLPNLEPGGFNDHFKYKFVKDTQVSGAIRPRMAAERLMVIPEVLEESWVETKTRSGGISWVTKLKIQFTVIDGDSGDSITGVGFGYGDDTGDKGANKAFTAAMKYWLIKLFQIGGEDDLESDQRADQRASDRQSGAGPTNRDVNVEGANITGIARGGQSDKATLTQARAITAIVKELELTPEKFVEVIEFLTDQKVVIPEEGDVQPIFKAFLRDLSADDAGKLISGLMEMKDAGTTDPNEPDAVAAATAPDDTGAH